jgi:hypothetical protein
MSITSADEFKLILDDIGLKGSTSAAVLTVFTDVYCVRLEQLNSAQEDEEAAMSMKLSKQFPLSFQVSDDSLQV